MKLEFTGAYEAGGRLKPLVEAIISGKFTMEIDNAAAIAQCVSACTGDYLEIGVLYGGSAILAAFFCRGKVYGVDPFGWGPNQTKHPVVPSAGVVKMNATKFGLHNVIQVFTQTHPPLPPELEDKRFDVAFIDGDHSFDGTMADWQNLKDRVDKYMLFHDVNLSHDKSHAAGEVFDIAKEEDEWEEVYRVGKMGVLRRIDNGN